MSAIHYLGKFSFLDFLSLLSRLAEGFFEGDFLERGGGGFVKFCP